MISESTIMELEPPIIAFRLAESEHLFRIGCLLNASFLRAHLCFNVKHFRPRSLGKRKPKHMNICNAQGALYFECSSRF